MIGSRVWELISGGVFAYLYYSQYLISTIHKQSTGTLLLIRVLTKFRRTKFGHDILSVTGLLLIICSIALFRTEFRYPGWLGICPVLGASLLIYAGSDALANRKILANKWMVRIGLISYPLYLWHWPLISFTYITSGTPSTEACIIIILLSVLLAWLTCRFIESPLRFGHRYSRLTVARFCIVGLLITAGLGGLTYNQSGYPDRAHVTNYVRLQEQLTWLSGNASEDCQKLVGVSDMGMCLYSSPYSSVGVALIGDSHANSLYPGIAAGYQQNNVGVINMGMAGCPPLFDTEIPSNPYTDSCRKRMNVALDLAVNSPSIKTIILAMNGTSYMRKDTNIQWQTVSAQSSEEVFNLSLRNTLDRLTATGKQIALVIDWTTLDFRAGECFERSVRFASTVRQPCAITRTAYDQQNGQYRQLMVQIQRDYPHVIMLDSMPLMCDAEWCYAMKDNNLLYHDNHHLSLIGSAYLGREFVKQMQNRK